MDDIVQKHRALVHKIFDLTSRKRLDWTKNEYEGRLETRLGNLIVSLDSREYEDTPFEFVNIWRNGDLIDSFNDGVLGGEAPNSSYESYWKMMVALRELAERQASKIDETLDELLGALDKIDNPPKLTLSDLDEDVPF